MNNPAKNTKSCPTCSRTLHKRAIVCHCGQTAWDILGGGFEGGYYKLVGELPWGDIHPLIADHTEVELGMCAKIKVERIQFNGELVKVRIRNTFSVFKRQPACVGCGAACVKCLLVQRDPVGERSSLNLVFLTADHIPLTIDHIVPKVKNGKHNMDNLQTMCFVCNNEKGKLSWDEYKKLNTGVNHAGQVHQQG